MTQVTFEDLVAEHRHELLVHCYRLLGSVTDAEDVLQESLLAAWRGLDGFEGRVTAVLAVPDRHQPLPQRAAHSGPTDPARAPAAVPATGAQPPAVT